MFIREKSVRAGADGVTQTSWGRGYMAVGPASDCRRMAQSVNQSAVVAAMEAPPESFAISAPAALSRRVRSARSATGRA